MRKGRTLAWDWYSGSVPENVILGEDSYVETSYSFYFYRSELPVGVEYGRGASTYLGTMFDIGPRGRVRLGDFTLVHGARIICDSEIIIGDYGLISWNVVLMDTYRLPSNPPQRRRELQRAAADVERRFPPAATGLESSPIRIERNVWVGFDSCILPGVTIGEGSIVGARSVVTENVPPYTIVAGNPARIIRDVPRDGLAQ